MFRTFVAAPAVTPDVPTTSSAALTCNLTDDVEDVLVPIERFKRNRRLSVTDLSAQVWCEKQLELSLLTGRKKETKAMIDGIHRHAELERADHETIEVAVQTNEDSLGLRMSNSITLLRQLLQKGKAREIWVYTLIQKESPILLRGIIDQLELRHEVKAEQEESVLVISDTKTRRDECEPSAAQQRSTALQLNCYSYILHQWKAGNLDFNALYDFYQCDPDVPFTCKELAAVYGSLREVAVDLKCVAAQVPDLAPYSEVSYECNSHIFKVNRILYSPVGLSYALDDLFLWWLGEREAEVVLLAERWKCRSCIFLDLCAKTPLPSPEVAEILEKRKQEEHAKMAVDRKNKSDASESKCSDSRYETTSQESMVSALLNGVRAMRDPPTDALEEETQKSSGTACSAASVGIPGERVRSSISNEGERVRRQGRSSYTDGRRETLITGVLRPSNNKGKRQRRKSDQPQTLLTKWIF